MSSHDTRQFEKMSSQISSYIEGQIGLRSLIDDLLFLRDALDEIDVDWETEFNGHILDLESAYVFALEKNDGNLDSITLPIVEKAIEKLNQLIPVIH